MRTYVPRPPLSRFVEVLWSSAGYAPAHSRELLLPTGTMELVVNLRDDHFEVGGGSVGAGVETFRGGVLNGVHRAPFVLGTSQQTDVIGVHFRPGGAFPFFAPPADALQSVHVALDALWGARAAELRERLLETACPARRFLVLEAFLLAQLARPLRRDPAVYVALMRFADVGHTGGVADVAAEAGLSQRRFIQVFSGEVGLTPKVYARVQRFQRAIAAIDAGQLTTWADLAQACGYYDQAHLINEFKAFSGHTPAAYLARKGVHQNHVPLD